MTKYEVRCGTIDKLGRRHKGVTVFVFATDRRSAVKEAVRNLPSETRKVVDFADCEARPV